MKQNLYPRVLVDPRNLLLSSYHKDMFELHIIDVSLFPMDRRLYQVSICYPIPLVEERRREPMIDENRYQRARKTAIFTTNYSCGLDSRDKPSAALWNDPRYQKALESNTKFFYDLLTDLEASA